MWRLTPIELRRWPDLTAAAGTSASDLTGHTGHVLTTTLADGDAPRVARRAVADCCARADAGPVCSDGAALMTSELVTNALLHGAGPITLSVDCGPALVRVEVGDRHPRRPALQASDDDAENGRGLLIVDALAASWGIDDASPGKTVWFELDAQP